MTTDQPSIQNFILRKIGEGDKNLVRTASAFFGVSRQAINRHLQSFIKAGLILASGKTKSRRYSLAVLQEKKFSVNITPDLQEDKIWREDIRPLLGAIPDNVLSICQYGVTEILNNAIDHSDGTEVTINFISYPIKLIFVITDNGVGIFNKIKTKLHLDDDRHALLELTKGKLTSDPTRHSGEGIFFTSRVFDFFCIDSGRLCFTHTPQNREFLLDTREEFPGTRVVMEIDPAAARTLKEIFDTYASEKDDYGFVKTIIPVFLAQYGHENLISRSQAKRLLTRFDRFKEVILDFAKVEMIGQAFADEIFRVFQQDYPDINITWMNANQDVENMIRRAKTIR
jgi:anti-sigma regulatory factor (Ser/Thr protein kinase)